MNINEEMLNTKEESFITRIKQEEFELSKKITSLENFLESVNAGLMEIDTYQLTLLKEQLSHMKNYNLTLIKRLKDLGVKL